jgi:hypothetical protein
VCRKCATAKRRSSVDGTSGRICSVCNINAIKLQNNNNNLTNGKVETNGDLHALSIRRNPLAIKANDHPQYCGELQMKINKTGEYKKRYFVVRQDSVLYVYHDKDVRI